MLTSRYFCQLYTIHGLKNGNYVPLVFCLLPSKTEICYNIAMWSLIINNILLKILLPPPRGEQGATGIILANERGTFSEKGHLKICGKRIKLFSEKGCTDSRYSHLQITIGIVTVNLLFLQLASN